MKKYHCPKHGNIGNPMCNKCWEALEKMCKDKNALLIYDKKDREKAK